MICQYLTPETVKIKYILRQYYNEALEVIRQRDSLDLEKEIYRLVNVFNLLIPPSFVDEPEFWKLLNLLWGDVDLNYNPMLSEKLYWELNKPANEQNPRDIGLIKLRIITHQLGRKIIPGLKVANALVDSGLWNKITEYVTTHPNISCWSPSSFGFFFNHSRARDAWCENQID